MIVCVLLLQVVDFDTMPSPEFNFQVRVEDPDNSDSGSVRIRVTDVNDNAPVITPEYDTATLTEGPGTGIDTPVGDPFDAIDIDSGENGQFE